MAAAVGCMASGFRPGAQFGGWRKGHFQIHFIYTGASESMFPIFPDGTTMLLDCGDFNAAACGSSFSRRYMAASIPSSTCRRAARRSLSRCSMPATRT